MSAAPTTVLELAVTVREAVDAARGRLAAGGVADARHEALSLYALLVAGPTSAAFSDAGRTMPAGLAARIEAAVTRRLEGWPAAYAAGRANFRGHWLAVDRRVLIPRPETEGLVQLVMDRIGGGDPPLVADVGTGSGAIAVALALEARVAGIVATDVSADALNVALDNAAALGVRERISFRRGNLLEPLLGEPVDVVVANPPYVATAEWEALEPMVKDHEPRTALDGGPDGLGPTRALAAQAAGALTRGGLLALELDERRAGATAAMLTGAGFTAVTIHDDLSGRPRYALGRRPEQA